MDDKAHRGGGGHRHQPQQYPGAGAVRPDGMGHQHVLHSASHIALVDSASGETVHPGFVTASGSVASPSALQIVKAGTLAET